MNGALAAVLIATFHVAGSRLPDQGQRCAWQDPRSADPGCLAHFRPSSARRAPLALSPSGLAGQGTRSRAERSGQIVSSSASRKGERGRPARPDPADGTTAVPSPLEIIRAEIRQRLLFFKSCSDAAVRRGGTAVHRLSVTWLIAPDGSARDVKLAGVVEPETAACLIRVGSRRFPVAPGKELTMAVPIVFGR